jgi:class 3 adenylate cyclase
MMIGLIGAEEHLKQGAIGDAVNVAARVQQLNLSCGYSILLTRATRERVDADFANEARIVYCGTHLIRGRAAPLDIFGAGERIESGYIDDSPAPTLSVRSG